MNPLEEVTAYLIEKIEKVNVNNPKANSGAVLIKLEEHWQNTIDQHRSTAFTLLQQQFSRSSVTSPAGTAKLTSISTLIGKQIAKSLNRSPLPWNMEVRLGDLFIEAFLEQGLVDLHRVRLGKDEHHYIVSATRRWTELADIPDVFDRISLSGTSTLAPHLLTSSTQKVLGRDYPLIKGETSGITLSAPWVSAVNKLQSVAWRINQRVLEALHKHKELFVSDIPIKDNDAKEQKRRSKKVEWSFIISKAEKLKNEDKFYQYIDADYRGRLYYIEPFLNFQGTDIARGLLKFARAKPMTEEGMQWLAIHTASSYNMSYGIDEIPDWCEADYKTHLESEGLDNISVDKMTLSDRIQWTNIYMEDILNAATSLSCSTQAEKPVVFLAACLEWMDIHDAISDSRIHMSRLPIPIDGSNNGWQHLGAISKDELTGRLVGLTKVEIQEDFYVQTAKRLKLNSKNEDINAILNAMPMKHIRKGISKRGSMTRAYSAGQQKIAENMYFDCKAEDYHLTYGIDESTCYHLAGQLINAIDQVCPGPLKTMTFLQKLAAFEIGKHKLMGPGDKKVYNRIKLRRKALLMAKDISDEEIEELNELTKELAKYSYQLVYGNGEDKLTWTTPSGFNVVYENWVVASHQVKGSIGSQRISHRAMVPTSKPDIRGFMCGISPNFIHSMDASHMALVIDRWKGDFGAVHDSFSTHASDVEDLLQLTKDVFIELYDVENFYDYIQNEIVTDKTGLDVKQPRLGDLDIKGINDSDYFFA